VQPDCVIQNMTTAETLYEVPLMLEKKGLDDGVPQLGL
jgi:CTP synthase